MDFIFAVGNGLVQLPWWGYVLVVLALTHVTIAAVTIFLHRHLMHFHILDLELARLLIHPEIDVVILVLAARLAEVGAHEILAIRFETPHGLMDLDELQRHRLA